MDARAVHLLTRLAIRGVGLCADANGGFALIDSQDRRQVVDPALVTTLVHRGLLARRDGDRLAVTASGLALLRRRKASADPFAEQHQDRGATTIEDEAFNRRRVVVNHDESPLSWLRRRKDRDGRPMIDAEEFTAGERLRSDFDRGQLMPRVTANWIAAIAGKNRSHSDGIANLTDAALAARRRVESALHAVGPEMAGIAVDFCCFLKGLEEIERDRKWPARSAKVVLRLALAGLARHYGIASRAVGPGGPPGIRHWGAEGYRPTIDGD
jgi:hypothetical protein